MFSVRTLHAFDVQDVFALCLASGVWYQLSDVWCLVSGFWFLKVTKEIMVKSRETGLYIQTQLWVLHEL